MIARLLLRFGLLLLRLTIVIHVTAMAIFPVAHNLESYVKSGANDSFHPQRHNGTEIGSRFLLFWSRGSIICRTQKQDHLPGFLPKVISQGFCRSGRSQSTTSNYA